MLVKLELIAVIMNFMKMPFLKKSSQHIILNANFMLIWLAVQLIIDFKFKEYN